MRKIALGLFLLASLSVPATAQTPTLVTGTVKDVNGVAYANARVSAQLIPTTASPTIIVNGIPTQIGGQQNASADANGNFTMNLFCNSAGGGCSVISPSGTQWQFTVNENGAPPPLGTGPQACSATLTITGASQSVSASFAACPVLGNSSGGGSPTSAAQLDPTQAPYNVKPNALKYGFDGVTSGGSNIFSSTAQSCSASDAGSIVFVWSPTFTSFQFPNVPPTAVTGCSGTSWTMNVNATGGVGVGNQTWAIGPASGATLASAYAAAKISGKLLALPCGPLMIEATPFPGSVSDDFVLNTQDVQGCGATSGTHLILHPSITNATLATGGALIASWSGTPKAGSLNISGLGGQSKVENLFITSLGAVIPGAAGKTWQLISQFNGVNNVAVQDLGLSAGTLITAQVTAGEAHFHKLNLQNMDSTAATYIGASLGGQGTNLVDDSIFAFTPLVGIQCNNSNCSSVNNYYATVSGGVNATGTSTVQFIGNTCGTLTGAGGVQGCLSDAGTTTWYVFGNSLNSGTANVPAITLGANSTLDMSGTKISVVTSGFDISGPATAQVNDRAGNSFDSPLTQFTGKYVPIGGGSVATNSATAATNIGTNLGATNIVAASPGTATYDVKLGFRQVTAGVGCGAGSNTVNGVLSWTAGGAAQATGSNGVPAIPTLTVSANGAVGTSSVYASVPVHADINTAISFTTTTVLASAGCTTTPQYVVDFSNI